MLGFRWPGTWSFALLTKVTPGIGLLWFAARREWRKLAIALATTAAIVGASLFIDPQICGRHGSTCSPRSQWHRIGRAHPHPAVVPPAVAAVLAIYAGRTDRKWLLPVVAFLAMPVLWWGSLSVLIGCVALERERLEKLVVNTLAAIPVWIRARLAGRGREPGARAEV